MLRRTALAALAIVAALAPSATAASKADKTLDGQRTTSWEYSGIITGTTVLTGLATNAGTAQPGEPDETWCTTETCDRRRIDLTLPAGRQSGRLVVALTQTEGTGTAHLVVNDSKGGALPGQGTCCATRYTATRMSKGTIEVVVFGDASDGTLKFSVDVSWKANPPHRATSG